MMTKLAKWSGLAILLIATAAQASGTLKFRYAVKSPLPMREVTDARELAGWLEHNGYDIAGLRLHQDEIEVITDEDGLAKLDQAGLKGRVMKVSRANDGSSVDANYFNPDRLAARLNAIHAQYPTLTRIETIGTSLQGRPILAMMVSTTPNANDPAALTKPTFLVDGQHHAREVQTSHVALDIAETVLAEYAATPQTAALSHWNLWLVPMLNVDGTNIVFTSDNMWRKNAHGDGANTFGVDINRNYPYKWAGCSGSSSDTGADDYHGASAGSEPETQALMHLADMAHPTTSVSYHSYSELVLYPFGCQGDVTGENELESRVGNEMAKLLPTDDGQGNYTPGAPWQILYAVDGDSMDYIFAQFGALSYTFEVNEDFQPDFSILPKTLAKHRTAWQHMLSESDKNMLRVDVVDSRAGSTGVASASVGIASIPHTQGEKPFTTNAGGILFKVLDPGTYVLDVTLADGRKAQTSVTMAGAPNHVTVNVP